MVIHTNKHVYIYIYKSILRRERGYCRICWAETADGDFETSTANTGTAGMYVRPYLVMIIQFIYTTKIGIVPKHYLSCRYS